MSPKGSEIQAVLGEMKMARERKTDMVILGLLSHEDLTGYDIKKNIDNSISFFWKGSYGSIYPALSSLEEEGLIKRGQKEGSGGREKIPYRITESGRERLCNWIREKQAANDMRYETLLKLFFGGCEETAVTVRNIELFEEQVKESLEILKIYRANLEKVLDKKDHMYYHLTVTFGIDVYETYLNWCQKAKKQLEDG